MAALTTRFGVSERRACLVAGQHRSTQRLKPRPPAGDDAKLRRRLRKITRDHSRYGWKMAYRLLRREGWLINKKRVQRVWREEDLRRPANTRKRSRQSPDNAEHLAATKPNETWALDFQFHETSDCRRLKLLNVIDEYSREALAMRVGRRCYIDPGSPWQNAYVESFDGRCPDECRFSPKLPENSHKNSLPL